MTNTVTYPWRIEEQPSRGYSPRTEAWKLDDRTIVNVAYSNDSASAEIIMSEPNDVARFSSVLMMSGIANQVEPAIDMLTIGLHSVDVERALKILALWLEDPARE